MAETAILEDRKVYTYEEAHAASLEYFGGDDLAATVWINKYALKDSQGNLYEKTPDDMHWRIANEVARIEKRYKNPLSAQEIYDYIKNFQYIVPQGSPMADIGNRSEERRLGHGYEGWSRREKCKRRAGR